MAQATLFISEQYLKDTSEINLNVDDKLLTNSIIKAQELRVQPVLGSTLYQELITQIQTSALTSANLTLLNTYVQPAVSEWAFFQAMVKLHFKIMNKAVVKKHSEWSEAITLEELKFMMNEQKDIAEDYINRLKNYLMQNVALYPSYQNPGTGLDVIQPSSETFFSGMYLGNSSPTGGKLDYPFNDGYFNECCN